MTLQKFLARLKDDYGITEAFELNELLKEGQTESGEKLPDNELKQIVRTLCYFAFETVRTAERVSDILNNINI